MSYKEELLQQIANNLNIHKFSCEDEKSYTSRILYSAVANWIFTSAHDISFEENYKKEKEGVSKSYITRRVSKIVDEYQELFPAFGEYLNGREPAKVVSKMRETIERAGFLIPTGFDEFVSMPSLKKMKVSDEFYLMRGLCKANEVLAIGLGLYSESDTYEDSVSMKELFYIPEIDAKTWTKEYIDTINWGNSSLLSNAIEFFDPKSKNIFYGCWKDAFPNDVEVTIYKKNKWDYGFAKKTPDEIRGVQIPDYLIGIQGTEADNLFDNDVRRFMYGLKDLYNNNAKSSIVIEKDVCILRLYNALPERELTVLQFMGWHKQDIGNDYHYYISLELLPLLKELLTNLNIILEEV